MKKIALVLGGLALAAAPVLAQEGPALAPVENGSELAEGAAGIYVAAMLAGIATMVVLVATDDDDRPTSP